MKCTINDIATVISERIPNPAESGYDVFVGLEHYDSGEAKITRYGSTENLVTAVKVFKKGDILLARRNVYLKRAGLVDFEGVTSGDSIVLRVKSDLSQLGISCSSVQLYLPFVLNTDEFWNYAEKYSDGTMSKRLSPKTLLQFEFEIPDDVDSRNAILWSAYETKESYREMIKATDEMVKSQFIEMSKHGCSKRQLGSLFCSIRNGANIKQGVKSGGFPITRIETIADGYVDRSKMGYAGIEDNSYSGYYLQNNDILMSHINSMKHIGKTAIYRQSIGETVIHGMNLLCLRLKEGVANPMYVLYLLQSDDIRTEIRLISKQAVNQASFTVSDLKTIEITLPSMSVQNQFEAVINQADKSKFELKQAINKIDRVMRALMQ